jgi:hypothetical protein
MPDQPTPPGAPGPTGPADPLAPETLKSALKAFRKRLKLMRLDDESKLGGGRPTTGGRRSQIMAIIPPNQFRPETWQELAKQGKLKHTGGGFYELIGE